jgi:hypothetical protein
VRAGISGVVGTISQVAVVAGPGRSARVAQGGLAKALVGRGVGVQVVDRPEWGESEDVAPPVDLVVAVDVVASVAVRVALNRGAALLSISAGFPHEHLAGIEDAPVEEVPVIRVSGGGPGLLAAAEPVEITSAGTGVAMLLTHGEHRLWIDRVSVARDGSVLADGPSHRAPLPLGQLGDRAVIDAPAGATVAVRCGREVMWSPVPLHVATMPVRLRRLVLAGSR